MIEGKLAMVVIRRFEIRDAAAVSAVIRRAMAAMNSPDYPPERLEPLIAYFSPAKVASLSTERACLVAEEDGIVVGTASLEGANLGTFFVRPGHQRRGIGTRLLQAIEAIADGSVLGPLRVESSLPGRAFYERNGFRATGVIRDSTAGPHVELIKDRTPGAAS